MRLYLDMVQSPYEIGGTLNTNSLTQVSHILGSGTLTISFMNIHARLPTMNNYLNTFTFVHRTKKLFVRFSSVGSDISYFHKQTEYKSCLIWGCFVCKKVKRCQNIKIFFFLKVQCDVAYQIKGTGV